MVLKSHVLIFLLFLISMPLRASLESINLGEKEFDLYYGPNSPELEVNHYRNRLIFEDEIIMGNYFENQMGGSLFELEDFFTNELYTGLICPDEAYVEKAPYIRYLFRLQAISYLFQSLREHEYNTKIHGIKNTCGVEWGKIIQQCKPKTAEMKGFLSNSKIALQSLEDIIISLDEAQNNNLLTWAKRINEKSIENLTDLRIFQYCQENTCANLNKIGVMTNVMNGVCQEEQKQLLSLCSEEDRLFGASMIPEIQSLIARSNGIRGIDEDSKARGCLRRFVVQNKAKESPSKSLNGIFGVLYDYNLSIKPTMPNGRLFSIGAMKEFTDKGLKEVFSPPKMKVEKEKPKSIEKKVTLSNPEFEKIVLPELPKKKVKKKEKVVKKVDAKPLPFKSTFLVSCEFRRNFNLSQVDIDMDKFYFDYVFKLSEKNKLKPMIERYSAVNALRAMKAKDALGTKKSPIPLKFIKFLVDNNMNQRLFNIIITVGEEFYVFNDIDTNIKNVEKIILKNDVSTNFKWQISIIEG